MNVNCIFMMLILILELTGVISQLKWKLRTGARILYTLVLKAHQLTKYAITNFCNCSCLQICADVNRKSGSKLLLVLSVFSKM